jgi:hypothetical protein
MWFNFEENPDSVVLKNGVLFLAEVGLEGVSSQKEYELMSIY